MDAAGRAMDMLALADFHLGALAGASDELVQKRARQEVVNQLAGAHEELGTLLGRLCGATPVGELERLRAELVQARTDAEFWAHQAGILRGELSRIDALDSARDDDLREAGFSGVVRRERVIARAACRRFDRAVKDRG
ncbi:hypothetical protein [Frankia sp. AgW1.1]|uniref:hypothetical protein n=1 Tax=Frankia sp. AgW1.1 TaxID=1836971 RepID=UPI001934478C|nr:hypothetical protein [Frankia sp. AgW1.1]MBL7487159.1 hypothetical protein [Frankia sp. AgW1.1]